MRSFTRFVLLAGSVALVVSCDSSTSETVVTPTFSPPAPLNFGAPLAVAIATTTSGATIHYPTDGSEPTAASPTYAAPVTITDTTTIRSIATAPGMNTSPAAAVTYTHRPVDLVVDDGHWNYGFTFSISAIVLNRFTPAAEDFPFQLRTIRVFTDATSELPVRLAVYSDADGDPSNGATLEASYDVSVRTDAPFGWVAIDLTDPVTLRGPGDVLVAVVSLKPERHFFFFDGAPKAGRTWWGGDTTDAPNPPVLSGVTLTPFAHPHVVGGYNLMVRGSN